MGDLYSEGAEFTVICKRCNTKFTVIRNWGGGVRRPITGGHRGSNPAVCNCGSRQHEIF